MGAIISSLVTFVLNFLLSVLPLSPFAGLKLDGEVHTAIGWLNWVVPFNEMTTMLLAWIAAATLVTVVGYVLDNIEKIETWLFGGA